MSRNRKKKSKRHAPVTQQAPEPARIIDLRRLLGLCAVALGGFAATVYGVTGYVTAAVGFSWTLASVGVYLLVAWLAVVEDSPEDPAPKVHDPGPCEPDTRTPGEFHGHRYLLLMLVALWLMAKGCMESFYQ